MEPILINFNKNIAIELISDDKKFERLIKKLKKARNILE